MNVLFLVHSPHDPETEEAKVEFAGLDVLLPESLTGGDQVYPDAGAGWPRQGGPVQEAAHRRRRAFLDRGAGARGGGVAWHRHRAARVSVLNTEAGARLLLGHGLGLRLGHPGPLARRGGARARGGAVAVIGLPLLGLCLLDSLLKLLVSSGGSSSHKRVKLLILL